MARDSDKTETARDEEIILAEHLPPLEEKDSAHREKAVARLRLLWSERKLIGRVSAAGLVIAAVIALLIPNRFTSTAQLMPPDQGSESGGTAMLAALASKAGVSAGSSLGTFGAQLLGLKTSGDLFIGILQSRTVEDDLIAKFDLRKVYGDKRWSGARKDLAARTSLSQDRKSQIITIAVSDRDLKRAQQMAEEYVTELNHVVVNLNTSSAHRERVFLENRLTQVQQDLESAEKRFSQFASKNTTLDIQEQGKAMIEAGASLEGQLIAAQTELEGLRQVYTDNNVRVRETQARIDELRRQLQKLGGRSGSVAKGGEEDSGSLYPAIRQLPLLGVPYADLYRKTKVQEAVFETLTQEYELAKVEEAKETPSVKVLDQPDVPERKSFPPRALIVLFGTLLAGMLGVAWILGRARWNETVSTDAGKALVLDVFSDVRHGLRWRSANGPRSASRRQLDLEHNSLESNRERNH